MWVGDYALIARIGEGGMGVVYLAQKPGEARVALKVLRPHIVGDEEARERLAREVSSLSRVRSPRVAEILDSDPWGPVPFVATRYVAGPSLHDHIRAQGPLAHDDLTWFAHGLAEALQAVHRVGVLHRDIKPSNVLLEGRDPILIDFGLARVADDANITRTGWLLGTPGYLAPEILIGNEPTSAADVHSWAATVAFAATGRGPFGRGPAAAVMDRVRRGEHDLTGVDPAIAPLLHAALTPEPSQRPSLAHVIEALEGRPDPALFSPTPTLTMPVSPGPGDRYGDLPRDMPPMREPYQTPPVAGGHVAPDPVRWAERLRRWTLGAVFLGVVAAGLVLAPYVVSATVAAATVILRSLSLSWSAATHRRRARGAKWYDGVLNLIGAPWHFLVSFPASLVLVLWTAMLVACAGLVLVAFDVEDLIALAVSGVVLGVAMWTGPGSSRLRGPVRSVGLPLARRPLPFLVSTALLLIAAWAMVWWAAVDQPVWFPFDHSPWSSETWLGRHL